MAKRKTEVKAELVDRGSFFERHRQKIGFFVTVVVGSLFLFSAWKFTTHNFVEKDVPQNYVCQVVGADTELGMLALKCMVK